MSTVNQIRVVGLFISPGHNFFGHHDRPAGDAPTVAVNEVQCVAGRGLSGDRFFDFRQDYRGQVTFLLRKYLMRFVACWP